jgi:hypothetical protein
MASTRNAVQTFDGFMLSPQFDITKQDFARMCMALGQRYNALYGWTSEDNMATVEPERSWKGGIEVAFARTELGYKRMRFLPTSPDASLSFDDGYATKWDYHPSETNLPLWLVDTTVLIPFNSAFETRLMAEHGALWTKPEFELFRDVMTQLGFVCKGSPSAHVWTDVRVYDFDRTHLHPKRCTLALEHNMAEPVLPLFQLPPLVNPPKFMNNLLQETMQSLFDETFTMRVLLCPVRYAPRQLTFVFEERVDEGIVVIYTESQFKKLVGHLKCYNKRGELKTFARTWRQKKLLAYFAQHPKRGYSHYDHQVHNKEWNATIKPGLRRVFYAKKK